MNENRSPDELVSMTDERSGKRLWVHEGRTERGSKGPFFRTYADAHAETRWGYFCGNCRTFDNAMDAMGRIKCNRCANIKKPDEWDAAHE